MLFRFIGPLQARVDVTNSDNLTYFTLLLLTTIKSYIIHAPCRAKNSIVSSSKAYPNDSLKMLFTSVKSCPLFDSQTYNSFSGATACRRMTLGRITLSRMTLGRTMVGRMTLGRMTLGRIECCCLCTTLHHQ